MGCPRVLIAGLRGGSGKTLVSLGLLAAWRTRGYRLAPFKKGPDYIDAAWLAAAAERPCRNLDLFLMSAPTIVRSLVAASDGADLAVIEGNRGLYDGLDAEGTCSTAELAKLLQAPVVLAVDCTKATRTVAATILGCQRLDPQVAIRGVVLNQVAGARHEAVLRKAVTQICDVPVLGTIPRLADQFLPERHLGLVPPEEHSARAEALAHAAAVAEKHLDLRGIERVARTAPPFAMPAEPTALAPAAVAGPAPETVCIGVFRDAAFQFYYPENLEALARAGARLIEISPLRDAELPPVDGLYIGGGFPETMAPALSENGAFLTALRRRIAAGLPVYAECGGAIYLGKKLFIGQEEYSLAGVLPVDFVFHARPQGHGYTELEAVTDNPFFPVGEVLRGHEFHYTCVPPTKDLAFAFRVRRGQGFGGQRDGLVHRNVLAAYTHLHALGNERWAPAVVRAAAAFRASCKAPTLVGRTQGARLAATRTPAPAAREPELPLASLVMVGMALAGRLGPGRGPAVAYADVDHFRKVKKPRCAVPDILRAICDGEAIREGLLWNTCRRFDFYGFLGSAPGDAHVDAVSHVREQLFGDSGQAPDSAVNILYGAEAWHHLLRTAVGLNSGLPGERDVLAQLQVAQRLAERAGTAGWRMERLLADITRHEQQLRERTDWGQFTPDHCYGAISRIVRSAGLDLLDGRCVVIGGSTTSCGILDTLVERFGVPRHDLTLLHRGHGQGGHLKMLRKAIGSGRRLRVNRYDERIALHAIAEADWAFFGLDCAEPVLDATKIRAVRDLALRPLTIFDFNLFGSTAGMEDLDGVRVFSSADLEAAAAAYADEMCASEQFARAAQAAEAWICDHVPQRGGARRCVAQAG
ncbi:MAG: cobyrinate a,c-diamide synthase [Planctomycetota bacterium]